MEIKFAHDWNAKLTGPGKIFTTIRNWSDKKADYYINNIGKWFDVILKDEKISQAKLLRVSFLRLNEIPIALLMVDTGYSDIQKVYKLFESFKLRTEDVAIVLVFEKIQ